MRYPKTGVPMQVSGEIIPGAARIRRVLPAAVAEVRAAPVLSRTAKGRLNVLMWSTEHGGKVRATCARFGISTSTFLDWRARYRRGGAAALENRSRRPQRTRVATWMPELAAQVCALREAHPRWGKDKLAVLLHGAGTDVSVSMVGRILRELKRTGQLRETSLRDPCIIRRPQPRPYAVRKPKSYLPANPGDLIQVDSSDVRPMSGIHYKHFSARDVICKWDVLGVFDRATASAAARFLDALLARSPYTVRAIQVDGGSEFKADFERLCQERGINLFVLPPRSPKLNGGVERAQRTHKEEFYEVVDYPDSIDELRILLLGQEQTYNTVRPHQALGQRTPLAWLQEHQKEKTDGSQMAVAHSPFPNPYATTEATTERRPL